MTDPPHHHHHHLDLHPVLSNNPALTAPASTTASALASASTSTPASPSQGTESESKWKCGHCHCRCRSRSSGRRPAQPRAQDADGSSSSLTATSSCATENRNGSGRRAEESDPNDGELDPKKTRKMAGGPAAGAGAGVTKYDVGWRRVVRHFSPSWFSTTMGTGIVSILLISIPYPAQAQARWLYYLSIIFFGLNTILFSSAFAISVVRYTLYPEIWGVMIRDPTNSLFLGTIPMGFATLVNMWVFVCVPVWGDWAATVAWGLWMVDAVVAAAVTLSMSILLMSQEHQSSLDKITAAQLLPIAATIVAAGTGSTVAQVLPNIDHARDTIMTSYALWGMSVPLAMSVLVIYYQRLAVHKLPPREVIVSCFLPLGPLGMGGHTILNLGRVARVNFAQTGVLHNVAGDVAYVLGFFVALIMWGFGLVWLVFALASIYKSKPFQFNMGWWGFTFPLGVFSISTITLGVEMPSTFFRVFGTILSVAVILLWVVVALATVKGAYSGQLLHAPCLANLNPKKVEVVQDCEKSID